MSLLMLAGAASANAAASDLVYFQCPPVAFVGSHICVEGADGTGLRTLPIDTGLGVSFKDVAVSPDGATIAYALYPSGLLFVGPTDGSAAAHRLYPGALPAAGLSWYPDGRRLLVELVASGEEGDLYAIDAASGAATRLTNTPDEAEDSPSIGADGVTVLFDRFTHVLPFQGGSFSIGFHNVFSLTFGGGSQQLTAGTTNPLIAPGDDCDLMTCSADGYNFPSRSPDSTSQLLVKSNDLLVPGSAEVQTYSVVRRNAVTGIQQTLATAPANVFISGAAYTPDGTAIAYVAGGDVTIMGADGSNVRVIATGAGPAKAQVGVGRAGPTVKKCAKTLLVVLSANGASNAQRMDNEPGSAANGCWQIVRTRGPKKKGALPSFGPTGSSNHCDATVKPNGFVKFNAKDQTWVPAGSLWAWNEINNQTKSKWIRACKAAARKLNGPAEVSAAYYALLGPAHWKLKPKTAVTYRFLEMYGGPGHHEDFITGTKTKAAWAKISKVYSPMINVAATPGTNITARLLSICKATHGPLGLYEGSKKNATDARVRQIVAALNACVPRK